MASVYALLVGIDAYQGGIPALRGCRNDVTRAAAFLRATAGGARSVETLCDRQATKAAVIGTFRRHLGQAGPGDTALFWFSGHGSTGPVPRKLWYLEPLGQLQTMLCVDSRHGDVTDLLDKELAVLIHEVARRGAHVAVVLDCCHAGGASRAPEVTAVRGVEPLPEAPPIETLLPELRVRDGGPVPSHLSPAGRHDHVALAACRPFQRAHEFPLRLETRGVFSMGLLNGLNRLGPAATYRELLTAARCYVENLFAHQVPELYPTSGALADQPFLGGQLRRPAASMVMRYLRGGWEIDAGACHGLVAGTGEEVTRVAVQGSQPLREARVVRVLAERSTVAPVGWSPDRDRQYQIAVSSVPLPATTVDVGAAPAVGERFTTAAPGGGPSTHVRAAGPAELPELVVSAPRPGTLQILGADGTALASEVSEVSDVDGDAIGRVVAELEHIARWRQIKTLANPLSRLANGVRLEVVAPQPGERVAPLDRAPLTTGADGLLRLAYRHGPDGWSAPTVFLRLRNRTDRRLFCVLVDLTDRFRMHADLFPGEFVGPGRCAPALEGGPVEISLPPSRAVRPGASVRDWLLLLVSETGFSSEPFHLPPLGEPLAGQTRAAALTGVLDRLGLHAIYRDAGRPTASAYDWTTSILPVLTVVPERAHRPE